MHQPAKKTILPARFQPFTDGFYETGSQVRDWIMDQARKYFERDHEEKAALSEAADCDRRRCEKRELFLTAIGGLPPREGPLQVRETGCLKRSGYMVRKLIYQSLPDVYVTANLYLPARLTAAAGGVLMGCGHAREGKAAELYQKVCISLVRNGFVVLVIDSPGQGEMLQCVDRLNGEPLVGWNTIEHSHLQLSASLVGHNIMRYFLTNAIRGIDLLCSLPEVDENRIGVTGNSGGGHLTQALMMTDPRIAAAMPCCSLTTREHYLATGARAYDGEQNYFGCIANGLDYDDFLSAFAPRPVRIGAAAHDFFPIEGVLEAMARSRRVYRLYGADDKLDLLVAENEHHGYSAPLRHGCVEWFTRHLAGREPALDRQNDDPPVEPLAALQCTRAGQVMIEFNNARSIIDLNRQAWNEINDRGMEPLSSRSRRELRRRLNLPAVIETPIHVRCTRQTGADGLTAENIFFFSEPGIIVTAVLYRPSTAAIGGGVLMLIPDGTEGQEPYLAEIESRLAAGLMIMILDPRGIGAVRMQQRNSGRGLEFRSTEFRVANDHFMLGTSIAARRVYDVLRALAWLRDRPELRLKPQIEMVGRGWPALYGLMAAAVDDQTAGNDFAALPIPWQDAFTEGVINPEKCSEPLLMPELQRYYAIADLT